jgi:hypothetical protein
VARCAVCLLDLRPGEKFALVAEYVIHRGCVGGTVVARSKLEQAKQEVIERTQKYNHVTAQLTAERERSHDLSRRLNATHDEYIGALGEIAELKARVARKDEEVARERNQRALAELQARSTGSNRKQPEEVADPISHTENEPVDITAARFSLLELD